MCSLLLRELLERHLRTSVALTLVARGRGILAPLLLCATLGGTGETERPDFEQLKAEGALRSRYRANALELVTETAPQPDLSTFRAEIEPVLAGACLTCHGPEEQKGGVRLDSLNPDLFEGNDVDWWLDVLAVLSNGEMPPAGATELAAADRGKVIDWLATEVQAASSARRAGRRHSSFRRMTRYEYGYVLQDLLGLPFAFAEDLPPDPTSEDGFQNSSEMLHLTATQLEAYLDSGRKALRLATVSGEQPEPVSWSVSMEAAAAVEFARQDAQLAQLEEKHKDDPLELEEQLARQVASFHTRPTGVHYQDLSTGRAARQAWSYGEARFAWEPTGSRAELPEPSDHIAIVPRGQGLIVELGDRLPDRGDLRVRVRASRASADPERTPSLELVFGWQASNDSHASVTISRQDTVIDAAPGEPATYEWSLPLSQVYPRNSFRGTTQLGDLPSPSEYVKLVNSSVSGCDVHVHHVQVTAPAHEQWPPAAHTRIFGQGPPEQEQDAYAREVLASFLSRAWRREPTATELQQKLDLLTSIRSEFDSLEEAVIEVLATALASPNFLYIVQSGPPQETDEPSAQALPELELATRLSMFLWCSTPDEELRALAREGRLSRPDILTEQVARMLADRRSRRLSQHFVRQWLGLSLLDFLQVDRKAYPEFDPELKQAMSEEPIELFHELLQGDESTLEFIHSSFTMANERLAQHYGLSGVIGNHFRRVELGQQLERGGLLTQAGLLAMNSDGKDSHPLKRGIWMLERLLNDPPAPPPPAVPEIDLADPEIAKLTLKQRMEDHRDDPACMSCHAKIDPWGIAFENFDAVGSWRTEVRGRPVDARSMLFNQQELDGMDGLKSFLLENRQDQFVRALVHKLSTYALGRPLGFADRASIERITAEARRRGDGLSTMVTLIATSELFRSR